MKFGEYQGLFCWYQRRRSYFVPITPPVHQETFPEPPSFGEMPSVDTPLLLRPAWALRILALHCLLRNTNSELKRYQSRDESLHINWDA